MRGALLKTTIDQISRRVDSFGRMNDKVAMQSHILAVNSMIEAARAGQHGRGFSVVAAEMKQLSGQTKDHADQFRQDVMAIVTQATEATTDLLGALDRAAADELTEKAQTLVQLIVRNLFERTADVRWWATDATFWQALGARDPARAAEAHQRLGTIHRYYTVYTDLVLLELEGRIVASAVDGVPRMATSLPDEGSGWFGRAARLASGHDYVVSDVYRSALHQDRRVIVYATPVREGGVAEGRALGVLAVYFDWEKEARTIVRDEAGFSPAQWQTRRVLLLDKDRRIIAASDDAGFLDAFTEAEFSGARGCYVRADGTRIGYARTLGYQEYDGLGWYGVVVDRAAP
jgi:hypothetical protein